MLALTALSFLGQNRLYKLPHLSEHKGKWKEIGKTTGTSYTVKKLAPATKYQFKIRACKQDDKKTNNNHYGKYSGS